jgi:hypothetical protein
MKKLLIALFLCFSFQIFASAAAAKLRRAAYVAKNLRARTLQHRIPARAIPDRDAPARLTTTGQENQGELSNCPICLDSFPVDQMTGNFCGHYVCNGCLPTFLGGHYPCPLCRTAWVNRGGIPNSQPKRVVAEQQLVSDAWNRLTQDITFNQVQGPREQFMELYQEALRTVNSLFHSYSPEEFEQLTRDTTQRMYENPDAARFVDDIFIAGIEDRSNMDALPGRWSAFSLLFDELELRRARIRAERNAMRTHIRTQPNAMPRGPITQQSWGSRIYNFFFSGWNRE